MIILFIFNSYYFFTLRWELRVFKTLAPFGHLLFVKEDTSGRIKFRHIPPNLMFVSRLRTTLNQFWNFTDLLPLLTQGFVYAVSTKPILAHKEDSSFAILIFPLKIFLMASLPEFLNIIQVSYNLCN